MPRIAATLSLTLVAASLAVLTPLAEAKPATNRARIHQLEKQVRGDRASIRSLRAMIRELESQVAALEGRTTKTEAVASEALNVAASVNWCLVWATVDAPFVGAFLDPGCVKGRQSVADRMDDGPTKP